MKHDQQRPTKEQVREWLYKAIDAENLPTPDDVRSDLNWTSAEPVRKAVLS